MTLLAAATWQKVSGSSSQRPDNGYPSRTTDEGLNQFLGLDSSSVPEIPTVFRMTYSAPYGAQPYRFEDIA